MSDLAEAQAAIRELHSRYTDAVFRHDYDAFAECFAPDGEWRISGRVMKGRQEIKDNIAIILGKMNRVLISFRTPILTVEGDTAFGRTYVDERCAWKNGNTNISVAIYYERFVRQGDLWFFKWRLFQMFYRGDPDMTGTFYEHPDYGPHPAFPPAEANTEDMASVRWGLPPA